MKNFKFFSLSLFLSFICFGAAFAQTISVQEARVIANQFINSHSSKTRAGVERKIAQSLTISNADEPSFYAFNREQNGGFVLVAADARIADPVIGYSDRGAFDTEKMNAEMLSFVESMKESLANFAASPQTRSVSYEDPVPALIDAEWGQDWPYNKMCPTFVGESHYPTGCVITAMAQIMYYHKWPEKGQGSHEYYCKDIKQKLSADFSQSTYRWDLMLPTYDENSSEESCDAVALLMKDLGIAFGALYGGEGGTGANPLDAGRALYDYFGYDKSMNFISHKDCTTEVYEGIMTSELRQRRPILISNPAHTYVIDGYNSEGFYHLNYGWSGSSNGYYKKESFMNGRNTYIIYNIKKDEGGRYAMQFLGLSDFYYDGYHALYLGASGCASIANITNYSCALAIENTKTHEIIYSENQRIPFFYVNNDLPDGDYIVYPVARFYEDEDWRKFIFQEGAQAFVDLKVENGEKIFTNNHLSEVSPGRVEIDGLYFVLDYGVKTATLTYKNDRDFNSYSGDLIIPETVTFEGEIYTVKTIGGRACLNCKELKTVYIPSTIEKIEGNAFSECKILTKVEFAPNSELKTMYSGVFMNCSSLLEISIPEGLTKIDDFTFSGCSSLPSITIPNKVSEIRNRVFQGCSSLKELTVLSTTPPKIGSETFGGFDSMAHCVLYVPEPSLELYKQASGWKDFKDIEGLPTVDVESIEITPSEYALNDGESVQLAVVVKPENATNKGVVWASSDENVVKVSDTGLVSFVSFGEAVVTATAADGSGVSASCVFTNTDGIISISSDENFCVEIFTLDGQRVETAGKGMYIIRTKAGKAKKVGRK